MAQLTISLDQISTSHTVFERDQVLTAEQLNGVTDYLDDQGRLTRVDLLGVGIACGLRVSLAGDRVTLTKGAGVTTDGDLLRVPGDAVFTAFKPYGEGAPEYAPFHDGTARLAAWELVREGAGDPGAAGLAELAAQAGRPLSDMAAVLLMESHVKDQDLCSGTDCDNLGAAALHDARLLLIDKAAAALLKERIATPDSAARALDVLAADRPMLAGVESAGALVDVYRAACGAVHTKLAGALPKIYPACGAFLADLFPSDPAPRWTSTLAAIQGAFAASGTGIQYHYDFLKDVVETYEAFREALSGDTSVCCPDLSAFPKHLLLGNLAGAGGSEENRTGFYPSRFTAVATGQLGHARFLAAKLAALIESFALPTGSNLPIRITPSLGEDRRLEERAIPYYYDTRREIAIHERWSHALALRGMSAHNYSYNAGLYGAQGGAANPLGTAIGRFSFFRIEGHLGANVNAAVESLEREIQSKNLPFVVRAVLLGSDRRRVFKKPSPRYSDLHRLHRMVRSGLAEQLEEAAAFGNRFKQQVNVAVDEVGIVGRDAGIPLKQAAATQSDVLSAGATSASRKLRQAYSDYTSDPTWRQDVMQTLAAAGSFKLELRDVAKTELVTPFDSLAGSVHLQWIDWLEDVIRDKEDKADERLLFGAFLRQHPGLEHSAGVVRGGTFVLAHDASGMVVADFMLPYLCCEPEEQEAEPPMRTPIKPDLSRAITLAPPITGQVRSGIDRFWADTAPLVQQRIDLGQKGYFEVFKDTATLMSTLTTRPGASGGGSGSVEDERLGELLRTLEARGAEVSHLDRQLVNPARTDAERRVLGEQISVAESDLADAIVVTVDYVARSGLGVREGTDGFTAMMAVTDALARLVDFDVTTKTVDQLERLSESASEDLKRMLGVLSKRFRS
ncbi:hypothetical protein [Sorangium sp. So ce131]|uniref:hypothetical protein n=1 Tax=Sorangium sp. So ce131 TaxID=3133282 RepID=UPI003F5E206A